MRRRQPKDRPDATDGEIHLDHSGGEPFTSVLEHDSWAQAEEERVARWLADKVGQSWPRSMAQPQPEPTRAAGRRDLPSAGFRPSADEGAPAEPARNDVDRRVYGPGAADAPPAVDLTALDADRARSEEVDDGAGFASSPALVEAEQAALKAEVAALEEDRQRLVAAVQTERTELVSLDKQYRHLAAAIESERAELSAVERQRSELAGALAAERGAIEAEHRALSAAFEAERAELREERRRLVTAHQADQLEIDRARRVELEAKAGLEAEVAELEERRSRLVEEMEAARAAAEQAVAAERETVARVEAAEARARRGEAARVELWAALDAEIADLRHARQLLRGGADA